jgi:outer membrane receptor protein involved in Fe transport
MPAYKNRRRLASALVAMTIGLAFSSIDVFAQDKKSAADDSDDSLQEVVVTGSRIASVNLTSTSPIQVVTAKEIQLSGKTDVSDILFQLPQNFNNSLGQDFSNTTSGLSSAGGLSTADLRGLGPQRTLVLVNGRRLGAGDANTIIQAPAPNLDQIPSALVERVEVVTGGASAVYGSDAIAGVVNFIMKRNFEGFQVDLQLGGNLHNNDNSFAQTAQTAAGQTPLTGSRFDGRNQSIDLLAGTNFADGRGNLTAFFSYQHTDPVRSGDRDFGGCQLGANAALTSATCLGSTNSNQFQPTNGIPTYAVVGNQFLPWGTSASANPPARFNSQRYIYIARDDTRYAAGFMGHVDLNDYAQPYFEFSFMNDNTHQEVAPSALFKDSNPLDPISGNYNINCSNPLLSAQQAAILCTPAQIAADTANPGSVSANVRIGRRNVEGGGRIAEFEHTSYRGVAGFKGKFADNFDYDVYGQYYYTTSFNSNQRYLNFQGITNALQVTGTAANPRCISGPPCVPYNIFRDGGVTQPQLDYLYLDGTGYGQVTQRIVHADLTADLGKYHVQSPWSDQGVALNIGYEHRSDAAKFKPDSGELSGLLSGFGSAAVAIDANYSVSEEFAELRVPVANEKPGIRELLFDAGFRRSDYTTAGVISTRKFELQYAPIRDLRFRGSYQRAIRAPNLIELFNPRLVGLVQLGNDPCAPTTTAAGVLVPATATLAQCLRTGVTAAQYGNGGTTNAVPQGTAGQLSQLTGGNPNLRAEQATSYSFGVNLTPTFLPNFTASIDYFRITLNDGVGPIPANVILTNCLNTGDPTYCSQIVRSNTGSLNGNNIAGGGYIVQTQVNVASARASGIDLQGAYRVSLGERWGSLTFGLNGAYLKASEATPLPGAPTYDCSGLFGSTCQTVNPRWRHNLRTSWQAPRDIELSLNWRYLGAVSLDNNSSQPTLNGAAFGAPNLFNARIPAYSYFDLAATWKLNETLEFRAGVNNLLDKDPPIVTSEIVAGGAANTYETYDTLGRQIFVGMTAKF